MSKKKGLDDSDIQVLAPMYKGINGIDNLNKMLRDIFNPLKKQKEIKIGDITYREKDKVIQLVNNPDLNVFNGDMGYITKIDKEEITIDFEGNFVSYHKTDMKDIMHAYAISIHKSQGSEFRHVILPIESHYKRMLYNKLLYTAVSRAKKSLVVIGEKEALTYSINNNYSNLRKTDLLTKLEHIFKK
jgi:exodeoxyribonuclease V alpha subunit